MEEKIITVDITQRVKSFENACMELSIAPALPEVSGLPLKHQKAMIALYMLIIITEALNEGWKPDWNNPELKYWPWFYYYGASAGFSYVDTDSAASYTHATFGARLCYKSRSLAEYSARQFIHLWNDYLLIRLNGL